jgi:hypothetical protein
MKRVLVVAALSALIAAPSFASNKTETITLYDSLQVGSTLLAPGDYQVKWDGAGPVVHVTLVSGKHSATADATVMNAEHRGPGVIYTTQGRVKVLNEIDLRHVSLHLADRQMAEK